MSEKRLPFLPEPKEQLKARYIDAVMIVWVAAVNMKDRPGQHREHIFDFEDGIRLVISRDQLNGIEHIHFSASVEADIYKRDFDKFFMADMIEKFRYLSDSKDPVALMGFSQEKKVPHWIVIEQKKANEQSKS